MIEHFLKIYVDEFGSQSLTCKFHYMVHYPSQILKYGPLKKIWNMRFEMKHQYLKGIIKRSQNYINPTYTLSERNQIKISYLSKHDIFFKNFLIKSININYVTNISTELKLLISTKINRNIFVCIVIPVVEYIYVKSSIY